MLVSGVDVFNLSGSVKWRRECEIHHQIMYIAIALIQSKTSDVYITSNLSHVNVMSTDTGTAANDSARKTTYNMLVWWLSMARV